MWRRCYINREANCQDAWHRDGFKLKCDIWSCGGSKSAYRGLNPPQAIRVLPRWYLLEHTYMRERTIGREWEWFWDLGFLDREWEIGSGKRVARAGSLNDRPKNPLDFFSMSADTTTTDISDISRKKCQRYQLHFEIRNGVCDGVLATGKIQIFGRNLEHCIWSLLF